MHLFNSMNLQPYFSDPLATNWSGFEIYITIILTLVFTGFAIYESFGFEKRKIIGNVIAALLCIGAAFFISIRWLNNLAVLIRALGWLFLILIGLASILLILIGVFVTDQFNGEKGTQKRILTIGGGLFGFLLCVLISWQVLHFPFLSNLSWRSPFIYGTIMAILISVLLGYLINGIKTSIWKSGNAIDKRAEWRFVGSNSKYKDATVRDLYEHQNGHGSWEKSNNATIKTLRWIGCGAATFLPFWLFSNDIHIFTQFRFLSPIYYEFSRMATGQRIGLYITLFIISGIITLYFSSKSEKYI